jgi:ABC-type uncharacterized transport system substrate-binding protein
MFHVKQIMNIISPSKKRGAISRKFSFTLGKITRAGHKHSASLSPLCRVCSTGALGGFVAARLILAFLALAALAAPAAAHPHVWVVAHAQILFAPDGKITAIRHVWTFDEMYSAFATQGLGKDGKPPTKAELAPLAKTNVESLAEFQYFTAAKTGPKFYEFGEPKDYELTADDKKLVTLSFTLPLKTPVSAQKPFTLMVYDPTYFVDFALAKDNALTLKDAPPGCSVTTMRPEPLTASDTGKLNESFFSGLSPGSDFGIKLAPRSIVACP